MATIINIYSAALYLVFAVSTLSVVFLTARLFIALRHGEPKCTRCGYSADFNSNNIICPECGSDYRMVGISSAKSKANSLPSPTIYVLCWFVFSIAAGFVAQDIASVTPHSTSTASTMHYEISARRTLPLQRSGTVHTVKIQAMYHELENNSIVPGQAQADIDIAGKIFQVSLNSKMEWEAFDSHVNISGISGDLKNTVQKITKLFQIPQNEENQGTLEDILLRLDMAIRHPRDSRTSRLQMGVGVVNDSSSAVLVDGHSLIYKDQELLRDWIVTGISSQSLSSQGLFNILSIFTPLALVISVVCLLCGIVPARLYVLLKKLN